MATMIAFLVYLLCTQIISAAAADDPSQIVAEHILLNCGATSKLNSSVDGQTWDGDASTNLSPDINTPGLSTPATAEQDPSISGAVPYLTARIIHSKFSYIFPLSSGQKILRLYFYPATYTSNTTTAQSFNKTRSFFDVTANQYTLLTNFNAFLTIPSLKPEAAYFVKEFILYVGESEAITVTFWPSANSYAFINGIEVVSVPAHVYMGSHDTSENPLRFVNVGSDIIELDQKKTAFETAYRLDAGGVLGVAGKDDTGMFRGWLRDNIFLSDFIGNPLSNEAVSLKYTSQASNDSAPAIVYRTARSIGENVSNKTLAWNFQVESGFYYMLRLHFCELFRPSEVNGVAQTVFSIFINNATAEINADVIYWTGGTGIPTFKDYVVLVQSKPELILALRPSRDGQSRNTDAFLNGLEIFKLNTTGGHLAGLNVKHLDPKVRVVAAVVGGVAGGVAALLLLSLLIFYLKRKRVKDVDRKHASLHPLSTQSTETSTTTGSETAPSDLCRRFLIEEIKSATGNFDSTNVVGEGGFGKVYRGYIDDNQTAVAIKRSDPGSSQGAHEFRTEIQMLSSLRHVHLVSLIGYCDDGKEMILVYDYMSNGTLSDHLYRPSENAPLTWKQRLEICLSAARGLHYLHDGASRKIIHCDVKSSNILLDHEWVAKISDFGLSKMGAPDESFTHITATHVKGTFGYLDPEYYSTRKLTRKSDVYAFGVVLFEVLSGRAAVDLQLDEEQHSLATWARYCVRNGQVDKLIDAKLRDQISPACLKVFVGVAVRCLDTRPHHRPAMADVVVSLEFSSGLQRNPSLCQEPAKEAPYQSYKVEEILE